MFKYLISIFLTFLLFSSGIQSQIFINFNENYKYLTGKQAGGIPDIWKTASISDAGWNSGNAPFWYGSGSGGTELSNMQDLYTTVYIRKTLYINNLDSIDELELTIDYDDGYAMWVNGEMVDKENAPATIYNTSIATDYHAAGSPVVKIINANDFNLKSGTNIIAIILLNINLSSSDIYFDMKLENHIGLPKIPKDISVNFSHKSGYYDSPFDLSLSVPDSSYDLLYTLDGSKPDSSGNFFTIKNAVISIDPQLTTGNRGTTPAFIVKASLYKNGYEPKPAESRIFIFPDKVITQTYPGGSWPVSSVNSQRLDYDMDPEVINDIRYKDLMDDALFELPVLSITTDMKNLFDESTGIYANPGGRGYAWERECSIELFTNDSTVEGFSTNAGLRIRGASSRDKNNPKHSLRLFFRGEYGDGKLNYPLFGDEGADKFDKFDLRTAQNYSWNSDGQQNQHNTLVRDVFSRDSQRDEGKPYTRSRYYHLYLNGVYWGIYQTQERAEARFAETYFGDDKKDYDVIKTDPTSWPYKTEVTDGNDDAWYEIYNIIQADIKSDAEYFKLEGRDAFGKPMKCSKVLLDIDNLIDYMIMIFYTGNYDAPASAFYGNKMPNNYYAIYNRKDNGKGYVFCAHDSEHSMMVDAVYAGSGLYENRVDIANVGGWFKMEVNYFEDFHPQWIHYKLSANDNYRQRFTDRAYQLLANDGVFSPGKVRERLMQRINEIDTAIIAESARWGDTKNDPVRTKDDFWLPEINILLNSYIPVRTNIVIDQLKAAELYSLLEPPVFLLDGETFNNWKYNLFENINLTLSNTNTSGVLYYTLDGSDPRTLDGNLSDVAIKSTTNVEFEINKSMIIKARIKYGTGWSALRELDIYKQNEDYSKLKITEINYHPKDEIVLLNDTIDDKSFEFLEFKNTGDEVINISGIYIDSAINYTVPPQTILAPGAFYVIASKPTYFYQRYGMIPSGNYKGQLANSGEYVAVFSPDSTLIMEFEYEDALPWPEEADGDGYTLVSKDFMPVNDPADFSYWRLSFQINGSPFSDDLEVSVNSIPQIISKVYPNPSTNTIFIDLDISLYNKNTVLEIYNQLGMLCCKKILNQTENEINLRDIVKYNGLYFIKISSGNISETKKIVLTN